LFKHTNWVDIHEAKYKEFHQETLSKLEDKINIYWLIFIEVYQRTNKAKEFTTRKDLFICPI